MTLGSWDTNPAAISITAGSSRARKDWQGTDGRTWQDGLEHRTPPWHPYVMTHRKWRAEAGDGKLRWKYPNGTNGDATYVYPNLAVPSLADWSPQSEIELLSKLIKAVKSHDFHIGVSLAEVDKTAEMVTRSLGMITRGVWELSRGNVPGALRAWGSTAKKVTSKTGLKVKDISGTFLSLSYGWTPLIQDVFSAAKAFEEISNGPRGITFKVGRRQRPVTDWISYSPQNNTVRNGVVKWVRRSYHYEQSEELNALRSMGLLDPLSVLWERLPWSFVVDWFVPIGTYLELIGQIPFLKGRFLRTTSGKNTFPQGSWIPSGVNKVTSVPNYSAEVYTMSREILSSLPVPFPKVQVAGALHGRRIGNAVALAHQMFDRAIGIRTPTRLRHMSRFDKSDFAWPYAANFDR